MSDIQQVELTFDGEGSINAGDFIAWLQMFRAAYEENKDRDQDFPATPEEIELKLECAERQNTDLEIIRLSKSSPMEIVFSGMNVALTAAIIFSGGEVELKGMKFKLPPMGVGVKSMREALGKGVENKSNIKPSGMGM